jgi:hypothetical protein
MKNVAHDLVVTLLISFILLGTLVMASGCRPPYDLLTDLVDVKRFDAINSRVQIQ